MLDTREMVAQADRLKAQANRLHSFYRGKIEVLPKCPVQSADDLGIWYTPGVAEPCKEIKERREAVYEYTNKWNTIAIITDGTRILGLGDIGPEAGLPVMEGKALLFKYLGGVDAVPICLGTKDAAQIIEAVKWLEPTFGGINLEDIAQPKCFTILESLRSGLHIPVWHDDQQGTATVALAGLLSALKVVGKSIGDVRVALVGAGAAGVATAKLLFAAGVKPANTIVADSTGILHIDRADIERNRELYKEKWELCTITNPGTRTGGIREAMRGADVCIAVAKPGPGTILPEWVAGMAADPIVFACANPNPEIWPWEAKQAGAKIVATGRSDFPNQVNNYLGFPGIFRGVLDVRARTISNEMCVAAAEEISRCAQAGGLSEEHIMPTLDDWEVPVQVAVAVGMKALEQGIAAVRMNRYDLFRAASNSIERSRKAMRALTDRGVIRPHGPLAAAKAQA